MTGTLGDSLRKRGTCLSALMLLRLPGRLVQQRLVLALPGTNANPYRRGLAAGILPPLAQPTP